MAQEVAAPANSVVKSVGRVLEVLELLREERRPLTATDIGRALGYPKSSANAILKSLVALGYLSFDRASLAYFPTLRVTQLGDWLPGVLLGRAEALNLLDELHEATSETVTLSMQNDLSMQFLRVIQGTHPISLRVVDGYVAPLFGTGVGAALLSTKSPEEVRALAERALGRARKRSERFDLEAVLAEIEAVRRQGYAAAYDRLLADTGAIAMPLPTPVDGRVLVVAVAGLGGRIHRNESRIIRVMRRAIARYFPARKSA